MNANRLAGHIACALTATAVWEVAVNLPAGSPGWQLIVTGLFPEAVAALSLALLRSADRQLFARITAETQLNVGRPEVTAPPRRKELTH